MKLNDLGIGKRIGAGFVGVAVLLAVAIGVGVVSAGKLAESEDRVAADRHVKIVWSNNLIKHAIDNDRQFRQVLLVKTSAEVDAVIARVEKNRESNSADLDKLEKSIRSEKGRVLLKAIVDARRLLAEKYQRFYALARSDKAGASDFLLSEMAPLNEKFIGSLEDLVGFQEEMMAKEVADAEALYANVKLTMAVVGVLGLGLAAFIGLAVTRSITRPVRGALQIVQGIAAGDLTHRIAVDGRDEIAEMLLALRTMQEKLKEVALLIASGAGQVASAAVQLSSTTEQVSQSVNYQSEAVSSMSAAVEEMSVSISTVADSANDASVTASASSERSLEGSKIIMQAVDEIGRIANFVANSSGTIQALQQHSADISGIANVIKEIADQTNLLALNAAIEAARAGEQGRGFAVVADEVRKLAERTTQSTQEISAMIAVIQSGTDSAVKDMESGMEIVGAGTALANQAGEAISQIKDESNHVMAVVGDISTSLGEQKSASESIAANIERIAQMVEENSATVKETAGAAHSLEKLSADMVATVAWFKTA